MLASPPLVERAGGGGVEDLLRAASELRLRLVLSWKALLHLGLRLRPVRFKLLRVLRRSQPRWRPSRLCVLSVRPRYTRLRRRRSTLCPR